MAVLAIDNGIMGKPEGWWIGTGAKKHCSFTFLPLPAMSYLYSHPLSGSRLWISMHTGSGHPLFHITCHCEIWENAKLD